jgi:hypothetical protein
MEKGRAMETQRNITTRKRNNQMLIGNQSPLLSGKVIKVVDAGPHRNGKHLRNSAKRSFFDNKTAGKKKSKKRVSEDALKKRQAGFSGTNRSKTEFLFTLNIKKKIKK